MADIDLIDDCDDCADGNCLGCEWSDRWCPHPCAWLINSAKETP